MKKHNRVSKVNLVRLGHEPYVPLSANAGAAIARSEAGYFAAAGTA